MILPKTTHEICSEGDVALSTAAKSLVELCKRAQAAETRELDALRRVNYWASKSSEKDHEIAHLKRRIAALKGQITKLRNGR